MLLRALLKGLVLPPGLQFIALLLACWWWRRRPRLARVTAALSLLSLALLSLPLVSGALMASLESAYQPVSAAALERVGAIVVLGGGRRSNDLGYGGDTVNARTLERLRYGAYLQRRSGLPLLVTGGSVMSAERVAEAQMMAAVLEDEFGVPVRWREGESRTTAENARFSARILARAGVERVALVTHAWHMRRAEAAFRRAGVEVVAAPLGLSASRGSGVRDWVVSASALKESYFALHEWLGYWVYRWQGLAE